MTENQDDTQTEGEVLYALIAAWNNFVKLKSTHPDDNGEFRAAIHQCQAVIGMRKLRRIDPDLWITHEE